MIVWQLFKSLMIVGSCGVRGAVADGPSSAFPGRTDEQSGYRVHRRALRCAQTLQRRSHHGLARRQVRAPCLLIR